MKNKLVKASGFIVSLGGMVALPMVAFAQNQTTGCDVVGVGTGSGTLQGMLCTIGGLLQTLIPILIVLGVIYFIWGVISYVIAGDEEAKTKGRDRMIYGIIGLFVIVAVWGLVHILGTTFGVTNETTPALPAVGI